MTVPDWWLDAICYQIYPRSFADANGDGIGDLPGIRAKLDYLQALGVTALWISPFFPSPQFDVGYDVADYRGVDPAYGTLADFDALLSEAHQRGMKVLLDLVLNHSSDQHEWFQQAISSRDNPYHDWYVWAAGKDGGPPNDWESIFGGSAWEYVPALDLYYYHYFFREQPDLNWRNPALRQRMFDEVRFWLDRGVDGFRLDAIGAIFEDPDLPNANVDVGLEEIFLNWTMGVLDGTTERFMEKVRYQDDLPENHSVMKALRQVVDEYPGRVLLGETDDVRYYGNGEDELHSVFNFDILRVPQEKRLHAPTLREIIQRRLPNVPSGVRECNTIGNHDRHRSASFYAAGLSAAEDEARYRLALALVAFLEGTPVYYNGEEIGMSDLLMPDIDSFRDNLGVWVYHALQERRGLSQEEALHYANIMGRDKCRTPMQWADAPNAGFCPPDVTPWLPVNPDYAQGVNVATQESAKDSTLHYFRNLLKTRQRSIALRRGRQQLLESGAVFAFWRRHEVQQVLVLLNMSAEAQTLHQKAQPATVLFGSHRPVGSQTTLAALVLAPYEVCVLALDQPGRA